MGKYLGSVLCIHHRDTAPSMAIYTHDDVLGQCSYYCFGCKASGYMLEDEADELLSTIKQKSTVYSNPPYLYLDEFSPHAKEFLASRNIESKWYKDYGIKETSKGLLYLPCYDHSRVEIGGQMRDINNGQPKVWSVAGVDGSYPSYSVIYGYEKKGNSLDQYRHLRLVESILDGLSLWSRCGYMSVALLGTNPSSEIFKFLSKHINKRFSKISIIFDPDNPGQDAAIKLVDKLRAFGYNVNNICLEDVVYRVSKSEIERRLW